MWYLFFSFGLGMVTSGSIHVAVDGVFHSFLWLSNIPLWICTTSSLSIPLAMDILVASMSWLLWTVLQWTLGWSAMPFKIAISNSLWSVWGSLWVLGTEEMMEWICIAPPLSQNTSTINTMVKTFHFNSVCEAHGLFLKFQQHVCAQLSLQPYCHR